MHFLYSFPKIPIIRHAFIVVVNLRNDWILCDGNLQKKISHNFMFENLSLNSFKGKVVTHNKNISYHIYFIDEFESELLTFGFQRHQQLSSEFGL